MLAGFHHARRSERVGLARTEAVEIKLKLQDSENEIDECPD